MYSHGGHASYLPIVGSKEEWENPKNPDISQVSRILFAVNFVFREKKARILSLRLQRAGKQAKKFDYQA